MAILGWFLIFLGIISAIVAGTVSKEDGFGRDSRKTYPLRKYAFLLLFVSGVGIIFTCMATVPKGHVGVEVVFQGVTGEYREQGLQFKNPLAKLQNMSIQTQKYEVPASAVSNDLQVVNTTITVNYRLDPAAAPTVLRDIGENYIDVLAAPAVQETVKQVTALYKAENLIQERPKVKIDITDALSERLFERGILIETVSLTDFQFSDMFDTAIEAKVAAEQAVLEAQNKLARIKVEAQQREAQAIGEANAVIAEAEGQAKAIEIVTAAQVKANEEIAASLSDAVLQYILYDRLGENVQILVIPGGQGTDLVLPSPAK